MKLKENKERTLKDDVLFKAFFSRKGNEEFLIDFLNAILKIEIHKIKIREEVNVEQLSKEEKGRKVRFTSRNKRWNDSKYRATNER